MARSIDEHISASKEFWLFGSEKWGYTITTEGLKVLGTLNLGINRDGGDPSICITYKLGQSMALADPRGLPAKLMGPSRYKQVRIKSRFSVPQLISDSGWPYIERQIGKSLD